MVIHRQDRSYLPLIHLPHVHPPSCPLHFVSFFINPWTTVGVALVPLYVYGLPLDCLSLSQNLSIVNGLVVWNGTSYPPCPSMVEFCLSWVYVTLVCGVSTVVNLYEQLPCCIHKTPFPHSFLPPWIFLSFCPFFNDDLRERQADGQTKDRERFTIIPLQSNSDMKELFQKQNLDSTVLS